MPYYYIIPMHQNNNTSTQQNRITPMLQYSNTPLHQSPDSIGISAPIICPCQQKAVPFLYKTEINSLARVTKIKDMVKNGAYNYITSHNRPVYTSDTFLYEFYSDWVPSPAMPLVNL